MLRGAVAVACALAVLAQAALFAPQSPVLKLTPSNFAKEVLEIEKPAMVAFTAPWCGHCKNLAPQYQRVASELDGVVRLAYVDCDERGSEQLCAKYGVRGFPTLKLFPATKKRLPRDYNGERSAQAITEYVVSALPAEAVRRLDPGKVPKFLAQDPDSPKVLLVSPKSKSSPMYRSLALDFRGRVPFGYLYAVKEEAFQAARDALSVTIDIHHVPALFIVSGPPGALRLNRYRGSMRYKEADAAQRIGEQLGGDAEANKEEQRKAAAKHAATKRQMEAIRRATAQAKLRSNSGAAEREPVSSDMLMDKLQELIGDKWGTSLATLAIEAREIAEKTLRENPAKALQATEESEQYLVRGITNDLQAIEDQLKAGADEEGYPLSKDMEESMQKHHEMLTGMLQTLNLRIEGRKNKKTDAQVAEELLAHYDL
ncbi:protein disulfide-isomerase [Malassezia obtusa]|uniref:Protein disulfide-isomerase n=1 Tax=Malassezia obtusa TaxID=76774 RepID=A0AAF0E345_9BASI|nr:protein disulfide-isomerase [Malassezia obtusa]